MSEKEALVNAERMRLQNVSHLEVERAKHTIERQAAIRIADFESNMIAAQHEAERAKHEAANANREKEELANKQSMPKRRHAKSPTAQGPKLRRWSNGLKQQSRLSFLDPRRSTSADPTDRGMKHLPGHPAPDYGRVTSVGGLNCFLTRVLDPQRYRQG